MASIVATAGVAGRLHAQHAPPAEQQSTTNPHWQQDLAARRQQLIDRNGPGTDAALRDQLLGMVATDQKARGVRQAAAPGAPLQVAANLAEIDATLTAQLKQIVATRGWPVIALVGIEASNGAMLVLTHSADHAWQLSLLPQLETLADTGKIDGSQLALVIDKELVSEGKLQRYGTQFKFVDGEMAMYGVEDPAGLDKRRAAVFLMPEDAYRQLLSSMYHLKAGNRIVTAPAPMPR